MTEKQVGLVGDHLKKARERLLVSQEELAAALGVQQQAIARWEAGKVDPASLVVRRLADALEVSTDYLLGRSDSSGESAELEALTPEMRKLVWLVGRGLTLEAIALLAGIGQRAHDTDVSGS